MTFEEFQDEIAEFFEGVDVLYTTNDDSEDLQRFYVFINSYNGIKISLLLKYDSKWNYWSGSSESLREVLQRRFSHLSNQIEHIGSNEEYHDAYDKNEINLYKFLYDLRSLGKI